VPTRL
jgi:hypothetical protein